jgi:hypothetical protein
MALNWKKIRKITFIVLGSLVLIVAAFIGYFYVKYRLDSDTGGKPYKHYIGYIDQEKALLNNEYELCDEGRLYHTYSSAAPKAYSGTKKQFRNTLKNEYSENLYSDSGYLNFRFLVNCEGNPGWFEIIQMNLDLEEKTLNPKMVKELFDFTANPKHWKALTFKEEPGNYYMYISYRIENGKITEIIP